MFAALEIEPLFRQALSMHQRGIIRRAKAMYEEILERQPAHFDSCHLLGVAHMQTGSPERAVDLISKALRINPESADAHYNLAHAFRALSRPDEALSSLVRAISLSPGFAEYHIELGALLQDLGRVTEALVHFEQATLLSPASPDAFMLRASVLSKMNRLDEALENCEEAIRLRPGSADSHILRGKLLRRLKRLEEALTSFDLAISLAQRSADAYSQRGKILQLLGRFADSLASYDKAIKLAPGDADTFVKRADLLTKLHRYDDALASIDHSIDLNSGSAKQHLERGYILGHLHRMEEAFKSLDRALNLSHTPVPVLLGRGWLYKRCEQLDLAQAEFEKALSHDPKNVVAWKSLAALPSGHLTTERALELLDISTELPRDDAHASWLFGRAHLLRHLGRFQESFESLREANQLRLGELTEPNAWRRDMVNRLQTAENWKPAYFPHEMHGSRKKLLVILGASRSGKTTLERHLCTGSIAFKRGFEGAPANHAIRHLQEIAGDTGTSAPISHAEASQRVFKALFEARAEEILVGEHDVVTITNPFLLHAAHTVYDLCAESHFIFLERQAVDAAAEIFAKDYQDKLDFAYSASSALEYVELYQKASNVLCRKMGNRAMTVRYEDLHTSPGSVLPSIHEMLGLATSSDPMPADEAIDTRSVYTEFFAALCSVLE